MRGTRASTRLLRMVLWVLGLCMVGRWARMRLVWVRRLLRQEEHLVRQLSWRLVVLVQELVLAVHLLVIFAPQPGARSESTATVQHAMADASEVMQTLRAYMDMCVHGLVAIILRPLRLKFYFSGDPWGSLEEAAASLVLGQ